MELYNYKKSNKTDYTVEELTLDHAKEDSPVKFIISYNSPFRTNIKENDRVYSELLLSNEQNPNNEFIILVHGFGIKEGKLKNYRYFIDNALKNKISCAVIDLPYHLHRAPSGESIGKRLIQGSEIDVLKYFHQAVVDIKKLIDIIFEIFPVRNISICGVSLGSIVSILTKAWDDRIDKGIFLLSGGNWNKVYSNSIVRFIFRGNYLEKNKITRKELEKKYLNLPIFINKYKEINPNHIDIELNYYPELKELNPEKWFLYDTLTFAHKIKPKDVLMINSKYDFLIPKESTLQLWRELGKPEIHWVNNLHTTKLFKSKRVLEIINDFLF